MTTRALGNVTMVTVQEVYIKSELHALASTVEMAQEVAQDTGEHEYEIHESEVLVDASEYSELQEQGYTLV